MTTSYLAIIPRDPVIARDGRPFGLRQGHRMRSTGWLFPSVIDGSLRSYIGNALGSTFDETTVEKLKSISIEGPLPVVEGGLFLPTPDDLVLKGEAGKIRAISARPARLPSGSGCDLPDGLSPALLPNGAGEFKPSIAPAFISLSRMVDWLLLTKGSSGWLDDKQESSGEKQAGEKRAVIDRIAQDDRIHVSVESSCGAAREGALFMTTGLDFNLPSGEGTMHMTIRVTPEDQLMHECLTGLNTFHPLGGERRLSRWLNDSSHAKYWECPAAIVNAFRNKSISRVRMVLVTPALFSGGWMPSWLNEKLEGSPPGMPDLKLRLVSTCLSRWRAISGWSLEKESWGPKAARRLAPAGAVYFFEVIDGSVTGLTRHWLKSVCDDEQDRRDGFGLAVWGLWEPHEEELGND